MLDILHEDADLLVMNKPAGLVCHPTKGDVYSSLISRVRLYLGEGATAHLINRIDRETSGVVMAAKNSAAAGELGKLWEARAVRKEYLAIVHGALEPAEGTIELALGKDEQSEIAIKDCARADGAAARTEYAALRHFQRGGQDFTLVRLAPHTGRKHQLRIHLAAIGHPIVGDKLYGADPSAYLDFVKERLTEAQRAALMLDNQALHAERLDLTWRGEARTFTAPPDAAFQQFLNP
ncbi:MAG TPA: RluA family pseudouridine synthase [Verrucomicrobiae bacterium]|nr:RluA family pseudouridine synthase [Verrucomicrobiae bacterium]